MKMVRVIQHLNFLAKQHADTREDTEGFKKALLIEAEAEDLIISYCISKGYRVNDFPPKNWESLSNDEMEELLSRDRFRIYLDFLTTSKKNVAKLNWSYESLFFEGIPDTVEAYIELIKEFVAADNFQNTVNGNGKDSSLHCQ